MRDDASAGPVAIEFANTRHAGHRGPAELLPDDAALTAWVRDNLGRDLAGCLHPGDLDRFRALRAAVRAVAAAISREQAEPADDVAYLNVTAAASPTWLELADGRAVRRTAAAEVDAALAAVAASAIETFGGGLREQVRACGRWPLCVCFFVKNHPRRGYCSPGCANRARAMRHHDRHKDDD